MARALGYGEHDAISEAISEPEGTREGERDLRVEGPPGLTTITSGWPSFRSNPEPSGRLRPITSAMRTSCYQSGQLPRSPFLDNFRLADDSPGTSGFAFQVRKQHPLTSSGSRGKTSLLGSGRTNRVDSDRFGVGEIMTLKVEGHVDECDHHRHFYQRPDDSRECSS